MDLIQEENTWCGEITMWKGTTFYLSENTSRTPKAIGIETGEEIKRANPADLELIYATDPNVFNGINIYSEVMLSCGPEIICSNEREQKYMDLFQRRIRFKLRVLPKIVQHVCIYGNSWHEIVYSKTNREILRLPPRDPKYMDFRRLDTSGRILFDEMGEPASYVEYLEYDIPKQPKEISQLGRRCIEIPKDNIMHTTFLTVGDSFNGIGLIEPLYNAAMGKNNAQKGFTHHIYRLGYPVTVVSVGSESFYPSQDEIDKAADAFKNINERTTVGVPYFVKPTLLESKNKVEKLREHIGYFVDEEITGMGVPDALVTGKGEKSNRSVLDTMLTLFYQKINMFQDTISFSLEEQVFRKIYEMSEFIEDMPTFEEIPRLEWKETSLESLTAKSERIERYIKSNALTPDPELEDLIREWERLPKRKEWERLPKRRK